MANFAVIDTETNWSDEVMSIGTIVANDITFATISHKYYIVTPEHLSGGMYSHALYFEDKKLNFECSRVEAIADLTNLFLSNNVLGIFAYNASFDYRHLPELSSFTWYDIMQIAAYKQYNPKIPCQAECFSTGRLKHNYSVQHMYRLLNNDDTYSEKHNALIDALDELKIMELLKRKSHEYIELY